MSSLLTPADSDASTLRVHVGDIFASARFAGLEYCAEGLLGTGQGGIVISARARYALNGGELPPSWDGPAVGGSYAVKIVRSSPGCTGQASLEVHLLRLLEQERGKGCSGSRSGLNGIAYLTDHFNHAGHLCLVSQQLPGSLLDALRARCFQGLGLPAVAALMRQLCTTLHALHTLGLMHADIKPENIMLDGEGGLALLAPPPSSAVGGGGVGDVVAGAHTDVSDGGLGTVASAGSLGGGGEARVCKKEPHPRLAKEALLSL